jgi:hypothetical protein
MSLTMTAGGRVVEVTVACDPLARSTPDSGMSGMFVVTRLPEPDSAGLGVTVVLVAAGTGTDLGGFAMKIYSLEG